MTSFWKSTKAFPRLPSRRKAIATAMAQPITAICGAAGGSPVGTIMAGHSGGRPAGGEALHERCRQREASHQRASTEVTRGESPGHEASRDFRADSAARCRRVRSGARPETSHPRQPPDRIRARWTSPPSRRTSSPFDALAVPFASRATSAPIRCGDALRLRQRHQLRRCEPPHVRDADAAYGFAARSNAVA